jgi:pyridoxal phosphate enzyme (YggS family)
MTEPLLSDAVLRERVLRFEESVRAAERRAGRAENVVQTVFVTKTVSSETLKCAYDLGLSQFGENRVQELLKKKQELPDGIQWHMIGHLQTNKVKQVLGKVVLIHSVDRVELVREIEKQAAKKGLPAVDCLIQVNSSAEESKSGVAPEHAAELVASIDDGSCLRVRGLMTIGPLAEEVGKIRESFRLMKKMQEDFIRQFPGKDWNCLSMGMSHDYEIAVEEGATLLRVGSFIFGARG